MSDTPFKYELLNDGKTKELLQWFKGERTGWVLVGPKKYFFPHRYIEQANGFNKMKLRPDDTFVMSYPRSGTTWTMELVWLLRNNLDFNTAKQNFLSERFPFLEFSLFNHPELTNEFLEANKGNTKNEELCKEIATPGYEIIANKPSPRFIKTHFPLSLLPGILDVGCKIVYVARNPKDVSVSWYHLNKAIKTQGYIGDFSKFWDYYQNDFLPWSPYWEHLKEAWACRNHQNLMFIFYEELQNNFLKTIRKIAEFLGKTYSDKEIDELAEYLNINNFRNNPMINLSELKECGIIKNESFIRKGKSGTWKDMFTPELEAKANAWIEENLKDTDLRFPHIL